MKNLSHDLSKPDLLKSYIIITMAFFCLLAIMFQMYVFLLVLIIAIAFFGHKILK